MFRPLRRSPARLVRARSLATAAPKFLARQGVLPASNSPVSPQLEFFDSVTQGTGQIPTYRVLDGVGVPIEGAELPDVGLPLSASTLLRTYLDYARVCSQVVRCGLRFVW